MYIYTHTCTYMYMYIHVHTYIQSHIRSDTYIHTYVNTHIHYIHTYIRSYVHTVPDKNNLRGPRNNIPRSHVRLSNLHVYTASCMQNQNARHGIN